jgi:pimeloyl-ACP methyl ester carboxylesterase
MLRLQHGEVRCLVRQLLEDMIFSRRNTGKQSLEIRIITMCDRLDPCDRLLDRAGIGHHLVTGNLKNWERWDRLHEIKTRALTIGAKYDEMDPDDMVKMAKMMPNATNFLCPNGSHLRIWDDQQAYFRGLIPFLKSF